MKKIFGLIVSMIITTISFAQSSSIEKITQQYLQIQSALANDNSQKANSLASELSLSISNIKMNDISDKLHPTFMQLQKNLENESRLIASNNDIKQQRKAFASLSKDMITLAKKDKISSSTLYENYCPMKKESWLSNTKEIQNPYFGSTMLDCGKVITSY